MRHVSVREARAHLSELLDAAERGEEVVIERQGKPTARLVPVLAPPKARFESRAAFRASIPTGEVSSAEVVRALRDEERH